MSRWRKYYFQQIEQPVQMGQAGISTFHRATPMAFVIADLSEVLGWSLVSGTGTALLHGAITRGQSLQDTLAFAVGAVGCAMLAPVLKNGAVGFAVDVAELLARRHTAEIEPEPEREPEPEPVPQPIIVKTQAQTNGGTWKFYQIPKRKSGEPIPARDIQAVARQLVTDNFKSFTLRRMVTDLRLMSDGDFRLFQADLVLRGWATKLPDKRVVIEPAGRAMLLKLANS